MHTDVLDISSMFDEAPSVVDQVQVAVNDLLALAKGLEVLDDGAYKRATFLYTKAREWRKTVEDKRKKLTEPMRRQTAMVNDHAKLLTEPLDEVINITNSKCSEYQERLQAQQSEDNWLVELLDGGAIQSKIEPINGAYAVMSVKTVTKFRVLEGHKVPPEYLCVDEEALERAIKRGVREIPGIEIYEEKQTSLRTR